MSHSLIAKRSRRHSRRISEKTDYLVDNMALASDSLFDKFGLFDQNSGISEAITYEQVNDSDLPAFEDLDFNDLLEIKDEPLTQLLSDTSDTSSGADPFFNMESLMDDASLDSIKSDCMWSSVNLFNTSENNHNSRKRRHRDVSLTLSECAEGLLSINQLDVNMLDQISDAPLGSTPPFMTSSFGAMDENDENETSEGPSDEEDDEIDVVGDLGGSSARTRHLISSSVHSQRSKLNKLKINNEAGRSLLKKQQPQYTSLENTNKSQNKMTTILDDHCYFLARPEKDIKPLKGMLTPNESSDDDEDNNKTNTQTSMVDKRKIAEAVQSLIKNRPALNENNIKFKFRMKFKSTKSANQMKKAVLALENDENLAVNKRERRKSASKNTFCPSPNESISPIQQHQKSPMKNKQQQSNTKTSNSSLLSKINKNDSEKCREIRDLHNSMERQRRVEQRNHLAHLKKQVPEVADMEKASKLTILRKAMDYCHLLSNMDSRIRKEKEKENARHQMLKKKLVELSKTMESRKMTNSGRLTGWSHGRY